MRKNSAYSKGAHAENFEHNMAVLFAEYNGLPADIQKQEFISNVRAYAIIRVEPRNPKYPILVRGILDNLVYKFSVDQVKEALEKKKKV